MRILVLHGPLDHPEIQRLEAAARQLGVELAISRADDEHALVAAIEVHIDHVQGVLISPALSRQPHAWHDALKTMRVPVVEVLRSQPVPQQHRPDPSAYAVALRSMVEMLRHPEA